MPPIAMPVSENTVALYRNACLPAFCRVSLPLLAATAHFLTRKIRLDFGKAFPGTGIEVAQLEGDPVQRNLVFHHARIAHAFLPKQLHARTRGFFGLEDAQRNAPAQRRIFLNHIHIVDAKPAQHGHLPVGAVLAFSGWNQDHVAAGFAHLAPHRLARPCARVAVVAAAFAPGSLLNLSLSALSWLRMRAGSRPLGHSVSRYPC